MQKLFKNSYGDGIITGYINKAVNDLPFLHVNKE